MNRNTLIYALVLLVALTAVTAMAQGRGPGQRQGPPAGAPVACQAALGLTQAQQTEIARIKTAFENDTAGLRAELQARMKEIAGLWAAETPDVDLIRQKAADADQVRAALRSRAIDARAAMMSVLTPEQRAKCASMCQSGKGGYGLCGGCGLGMGMCGVGPGGGKGPGAGACMAGQGMGRGPCGAGMGAGAGAGRGAR